MSTKLEHTKIIVGPEPRCYDVADTFLNEFFPQHIAENS